MATNTLTTSRDLYQSVSARILAELEAGAVPWIKPWSATAGMNTPCNAVTNRPYSGCNVILLWMAQAASPRSKTVTIFITRSFTSSVIGPGIAPGSIGISRTGSVIGNMLPRNSLLNLPRRSYAVSSGSTTICDMLVISNPGLAF